MAKNTGITLGEHFEGFIAEQISEGRYGSASEVIRASLRLLEEHKQKIQTLRNALIAGEESGDATLLDIKDIKGAARKKAGWVPNILFTTKAKEDLIGTWLYSFQEWGEGQPR